MKLSPYLDVDQVLRIGGRIKAADMTIWEGHPILIRWKHHIAPLLMCHFHEIIEHQGRRTVYQRRRIPESRVIIHGRKATCVLRDLSLRLVLTTTREIDITKNGRLTRRSVDPISHLCLLTWT